MEGEKSLLHRVLQGLSEKRKPKYNTKSTVDYRKCLDYLLKEKLSQIPIHHCDNRGYPTLHYAALEEDSQYTKALIEHGASIGHLNQLAFFPLKVIRPQNLEEILDNCVECTNEIDDDPYILTTNFNMLKPTEGCDTTKQTKDAD
jgi:ankyrin repeat protein